MASGTVACLLQVLADGHEAGLGCCSFIGFAGTAAAERILGALQHVRQQGEPLQAQSLPGAHAVARRLLRLRCLAVRGRLLRICIYTWPPSFLLSFPFALSVRSCQHDPPCTSYTK